MAPSEQIKRFPVGGGVELVGTALGPSDGPGVLLLHGGGQTRQSWAGTAEQLAAAGRHAVMLDMRGHGDSTWAPGGAYRVADFADDVRYVLETFHRPPVVVGASLGGITTLILTELHGQHLLKGVVLVDIAPSIEPEGARRIAEWMLAFSDGFESLEAVADAIAQYNPHRKRALNLSGLERVVRRGEDGRYRWHWDPRFISETGPVEVADSARLLRAARNLHLPTLLVRGRESDIISPEGAEEFLAAVPHAEFVDVSGAGHMVAGDRNDAFTTAVADFLQRHDPVGEAATEGDDRS